MKLLVGLGNPGPEHQHNRHNVGFLFLDYLVRSLDQNSKFTRHSKLDALCCQVSFDASQLLLFKPQTFMNSSGKAVAKAVTYYQLQVEHDVILIHDDLDLSLGEFKLQFGKGPRIHNGVNSVTSLLKTSDFWRIRIGIAGSSYQEIKNKHLTIADHYILKDFSDTELKQMEITFSGIVPELKNLLSRL